MSERNPARQGLHQDSYQRADILRSTTGAPAAGRASTTQPLRPEVEAEIAGMVAKAPQAFAHLEPRIELLVRACAGADARVPGVAPGPYVHALTPHTEQLVAYLAQTLTRRPELLRDVQVAAFRFFDARAAIARAESALRARTADVRLLEELRQKFFYLGQLHAALAGDPVLTQLFPPPTTAPPPRPAATTPDEDHARKLARDAAIVKAQALFEGLEPKVASFRIAVAPATGKGFGMGGMFTQEGRLGRVLALRAMTDAVLCAQLSEAVQLHEALGQAIERARAGGPAAALEAAVLPLVTLTVSLARNPLMSEFFPDEAAAPAWASA